ncbi:hypothetical protein PsorP6_011782 [Peronosclerospora sorghi]|uniref:Uncharacterized protein n=1 Tax=Peronosclerospora sorghi TaxID=230839 RepID=A0ACC0WKL6_9STRA|nr:hypothetical protein PsorP6_011782 [Peronosclerospora sorghi]
MGFNMLDAGTNQEDGTWQDYAHATLQKEQKESDVVQKKNQANSEGVMKSVKEKKHSHDKKKGGKKNAKKLHLFLTKIDALRKEKENLVKLHCNEVETLEKAHVRAIEGLHELQEQVELLTREKTQTIDERGFLETQLKKTRALLAAKSAELKEATEILELCKEDRTASRAKVDAQVSERNEFTREIMDQ